MAAQFSILTVCTGNIHRSPFAAYLLETWAGWYLPAPLAGGVVVHSAGFGAPVGAPMGRRANALALSFGADGSGHVATQISDQLIVESDLVLTATRRQRDQVLARVPAALRRTFTIREAGRIAAALSKDLSQASDPRGLKGLVARLADERIAQSDDDEDDVTDPQGNGDAAYVQMAVDEVVPLAHLAKVLFGMPRPDLDAYIAAARDHAALTELIAGVESP